MLTRISLCLTLSFCLLAPAHASELEGDQLYRVSTVRAAPGSFETLLEEIASRKEPAPFPLIMRHSQGDQWDLMIIEPVEPSKAIRDGFLAELGALVAFEEDHFAYGPSRDALRAAYEDNAFYHIEMFEAAAGKSDELLRQRRMENAYLIATGQVPNAILRRAAGSDVDVFTIGFHKDLEAFAAPSDASDDVKEAAAIEAGFKSRADISFYLRSLITGHHDTLAIKAR